MRIKMIKILSVLIISLAVQVTLTPFSILFPDYWWVSYVIAVIVAGLVHESISKWIDKNKEKIPK
jgi:hypothetical protein